MIDESLHLALADKHLAEAKARLNKQRQIVERLKAKGQDVFLALKLQGALEASLDELLRHPGSLPPKRPRPRTNP